MSAGRMTPESQNGRSHHHNHHGHHGHHHTPNNHHGAAGGSRRPQQDWAQINDWEMHRDRITELYRDQGLHLKQVQKIMAEQHQFYASQRMYKTRISKWAIDKNLKAADVATLLRLQQQRAALGKKSKFTIRGRDIDFARVDQYLKRDPTLLKRSQHGEDPTGDILPSHMEAAGITCRTPSPTPPPSPSPPAQHYRQQHHHHDPYYSGHGQHQLHHPYHQQHHHNPYGQHHNHFATTVPIVPSHTPIPMVTTASTFPTLTPMSSAPFTTTQGSTIPSISLPTAALPYIPLHTAHSVSSFDHHQRTLPSQHAAYDARRNSIANPQTLLSSVPQSSMPSASNISNVNNVSNVSPYISSSFPPHPQTPVLFASASPINESSIQDDLTRLTREYVNQALHQGMWVQSGNSMFVSTKANDGSGAEASTRLAAWGQELRAGRQLIADGILDDGFRSVNRTMDNLRQHLQDEDPSLLFYLLYSTAFGTRCPLDRLSRGRDSTAELRQISVALGRQVRSLTHIVLGEQHPIARMMRHLLANDGRLRSPSHMAALAAPVAAMRDILAEHNPVGVDRSAAAQCQRLAFLLRLDRNNATEASDKEREDLTERLQGAPNLHTKMQFYTTYMEFLSDLVTQQDKEQRNKAAAEADTSAVHAWSGGSDMDPGVAVSAAGLSTLTPAYSSASDCGATPESTYTTATATVTADNVYQHGKPTLTPVLTGLHGHGQTHGHTPVSNMHSPLSNHGSSGSSPGSSPSQHSLPMADVSSAMIPPPPTTMTTPRTILSGGQHHHSQQHGHSPYTLQPSAYPPVPTTFHHHGGQAGTGMTLASGHQATLAAHNLAGQHHGSSAQMAANSMHDPGSMTWELGDAADVNWV
ncbi:hypothetical protein Sste5346_009507 [Sporothrix stenoceras]|uniref:Clr5 domain-containing protein n=1 Tax=Sporothrix stenoceras TaxID=5173 RepID=A0ABR3YL85_9PEZI